MLQTLKGLTAARLIRWASAFWGSGTYLGPMVQVPGKQFLTYLEAHFIELSGQLF